MNQIFAHAGHPEASASGLQHGVSHWVLLVPLTIAVLLLLALVVWLSRPKPQPQESKEDE